MKREVLIILTLYYAFNLTSVYATEYEVGETILPNIKNYEFQKEDLGILGTDEEELVNLLSSNKNTEDLFKNNTIKVHKSKKDQDVISFIQKRGNTNSQLIRKYTNTSSKINFANFDSIPSLFHGQKYKYVRDPRKVKEATELAKETMLDKTETDKSIMDIINKYFGSSNITSSTIHTVGESSEPYTVIENDITTSSTIGATRTSIVRAINGFTLDSADILGRKTEKSGSTDGSSTVSVHDAKSTSFEDDVSENSSSANELHNSSFSSALSTILVSSTTTTSDKTYSNSTESFQESSSFFTSVSTDESLPSKTTSINDFSSKSTITQNETLQEVKKEIVKSMGGLVSVSIAASCMGLAAFICGVILVCLGKNQKGSEHSRQDSYKNFEDV